MHNSNKQLEKVIVVVDSGEITYSWGWPGDWSMFCNCVKPESNHRAAKGLKTFQLAVRGVHSSQPLGLLNHRIYFISWEGGEGRFNSSRVEDDVDVGSGKGAVWTWNLQRDTSA
jgi:hypothetical protein